MMRERTMRAAWRSASWAAALLASAAAFGQTELADVLVRVVSPDGLPVEQAEVGVDFSAPWAVDKGGWETVEGRTDTAGVFRAASHTGGRVAIKVKKDGWYPSWAEAVFDGEVEGGYWLPRDRETVVALKPVGRPAPMYVRRVEEVIPARDEACGYDLARGEWTGPHGQGASADVFFTLRKRYNDWNDFDVSLEVGFPNPGDGIQEVRAPVLLGSWLRLPAEAPEDGYEASFRKSISCRPGKGYRGMEGNEDRNFIYRVRTAKDDQGRILSARYGKIHGDFELAGYATPRTTVAFTYYFNPDGSRNLEFDPKRNLAGNEDRADVDLP